MSTKRFGIFFLRLYLKLLTKVQKTSMQKPGLFYIMQITQAVDKIKKIPHTNL